MTKEEELSDRQTKILGFIHDCMEQESRPPTIREIGGALQISSTSVVNYNLNRLQEKGLLHRDRTVSRGLRLTDRASQMLVRGSDAVSGVTARVAQQVQNLIRIPIYGNIVAGQPIDIVDSSFAVYDDDDFVEVGASLVPGKKDGLFALRVDGYSMVDDMISDGDVVILRQQETAVDGDVVAAWVEGEGNTLKRFYVEPRLGKVRLQPRNPGMDAIFVDPDDIKIQGKVVLTLSRTA
jgi:repressor LexA